MVGNTDFTTNAISLVTAGERCTMVVKLAPHGHAALLTHGCTTAGVPRTFFTLVMPATLPRALHLE